MEKLLATKQQCKKILELGINCGSVIGVGDGPRWTKDEIDIMIGPDWPKPEIEERSKPGKNGTTETYLEFPVKYPNKMIVFNHGAHASADVLIFLLENNAIHPAEAIKRYNQFFKD